MRARVLLRRRHLGKRAAACALRHEYGVVAEALVASRPFGDRALYVASRHDFAAGPSVNTNGTYGVQPRPFSFSWLRHRRKI